MKKPTYVKAGQLENNSDFYKFPKFLNEIKGLKSDSKILYMMICDRMSLSEINGWQDDEGFLFCYFTVDEACEKLGVAKNTSRNAFTQLVELELIGNKRQGLSRPNMIYLADVSTIETFRSSEVKPPEVQRLTSSNTNTSNTKTKTKEQETFSSKRGFEDEPPQKKNTLFDTKELSHKSRVQVLEEQLDNLDKNKHPKKSAQIKLELAELLDDYSKLTSRDVAQIYKDIHLDYYLKPIPDFHYQFVSTVKLLMKLYADNNPKKMLDILGYAVKQYQHRKEKNKFPTLCCDIIAKPYFHKDFFPKVLANLERIERNGQSVSDKPTYEERYSDEKYKECDEVF